MFRKQPSVAKINGSDPRAVDWIILSASVVGLIIVIAVSIVAGENGLAANLASYVTTTVAF